MTFILNQYEIEDAQREAAEDHFRPNAQEAVLTLARLMEWTNSNSDGWAYWRKPVAAATKLQNIVKGHYGFRASEEDVSVRELKAAYTPIKAFLTRNGTDHREVFPNG